MATGANTPFGADGGAARMPLGDAVERVSSSAAERRREKSSRADSASSRLMSPRFTSVSV